MENHERAYPKFAANEEDQLESLVMVYESSKLAWQLHFSTQFQQGKAG